MKTKVTLLLIAFALFSASASAERWALGKGSTLWTGNLAVAFSGGDLFENANDESMTFAAFTFSALHFYIPHVAAGAALSFAHYDQGSSDAFIASFGPWVGVYVGSARMHTFPYARAGYEHIEGNYEEDAHGHSWNVCIGNLSMLSAKLGVSLEIKYSAITLTTMKRTYTFDPDGGQFFARVNGAQSGHIIAFTIGLVGVSF